MATKEVLKTANTDLECDTRTRRLAAGEPPRTHRAPSPSRPGGNVTGVVFDTVELSAKRLGLLTELVPKAAVVAVLLDPTLPDAETEKKDAEEPGRTKS